MGFKRSMRMTGTNRMDALRQQLVLQQEECTRLWAEMGAREKEYVERMQSRAPSAQALKKYERLWDQYLEAEKRRVLLRGVIAGGGGGSRLLAPRRGRRQRERGGRPSRRARCRRRREMDVVERLTAALDMVASLKYQLVEIQPFRTPSANRRSA